MGVKVKAALPWDEAVEVATDDGEGAWARGGRGECGPDEDLLREGGEVRLDMDVDTVDVTLGPGAPQDGDPALRDGLEVDVDEVGGEGLAKDDDGAANVGGGARVKEGDGLGVGGLKFLGVQGVAVGFLS